MVVAMTPEHSESENLTAGISRRKSHCLHHVKKSGGQPFLLLVGETRMPIGNPRSNR
jgi:hypothetical protein